MAYATSPCRWSAKRYILAALAGTLVLTVIVIVVSVVLSPAAIRFAVTTSTPSFNRTTAGVTGTEWNLILTANNTSHRAGVKYRSLIVTLRYTPAATGKETSLPLDQVSAPSWQLPGSTASINVSLFLPDNLLHQQFAGRGYNATLVGVLLDTLVRFKYGCVYTRSYNIRVLCKPVDYFSRPPPGLPIICNDD
ncbi:unnamed protein product [Urochloa decumbens]|uniref:Late embryogenesis abundant protein LEA-2 subgroup domain-containing protein n=1 Tax=Urochloa decumbens TaxID=240449 RepID=A0ABC9H1C6_9POAL